MSYLIDRLVQRQIVEQSWNILLDIDEVPPFPEEEELLAKMEAETDDLASDELLVQYFETLTRHLNSAPLVGGPLPDFADIAERDGEPVNIGQVSPALRTLKPFCRRIVTKFTGMGIKVGVFMDSSVGQALTREQLIQAGNSFRQELEEAAVEEDAEIPADPPSSDKRKAGRKKKPLPVAIIFDLVLLGSHINTPSAQARLRKLECFINRKDRVFISTTLIDSATDEVWTTWRLGGLGRRRQFRYALAHIHQRPADIRAELESRRFNWKAVLFAVITALSLTGLSYYLQLKTSLHPLIMLASDVLIPLIVILGAVSFNRLHHQATRQAKYSLIGYFGVYLPVLCWLVWPVSVAFAVYLAKVALIVSFVAVWASMMMELE